MGSERGARAPRYDPASIEGKWQERWERDKTFRTENDPAKPKYYVLDMFPYPSGAGLHVGHPEGYTATDIVARHKRMRGFDVLHPMGWDSFGLPAENHAIRTGTHPAETTRRNIRTFKRQLKSLGFSYDWDREIATSHVGYYRWTQWIFIKLYEKGLAFETEAPVNWCPALGTVLANEEVEGGRSAEGGHPVVRRPMRQWALRITEYADRLLEDLDGLDWPAGVKELQRNWIGRSTGAEIAFAAEGAREPIRVFSTRPDTLFGATYLVLAPEHPLVPVLATEGARREVDAYVERAARKSDRERTEDAREKTGVPTGAFAANPANGRPLPVWVADYVLASYGTGAVMGVPSCDQRDWEFARAFGLPVVDVIRGGDSSRGAFLGDGPHVNSGFLDGMLSGEAIEAMTGWLAEKGLGAARVNYKLRDWLFSRQRYWGEPFPILKDPETGRVVRCLGPEELPVVLPPVGSYEPSGTGESPLAAVEDWVLVDDPVTGRRLRRETHTMPQWAGSCWYYLRFLDPHDEERPWDPALERRWMPVDLYVGGVEHAVLHLLYARFWHKVLFDLGLVSTPEPFAKLVNQGMILGEDGEKMSKSRGNVVNPDDVVARHGADALRLYEMFMGPLTKTKPWQTKGVKGVAGFLARTFALLASPGAVGGDDDPDVARALHRCVRKVTEDVEALRFNTAIAAMMSFMGAASKAGRVSKETAETFVLVLAPFAPHLAEELWERLGHRESLAREPWPEWDEGLAREETVVMAVQIDGRVRAKLRVPAGLGREEFLALAREDAGVRRRLEGRTVVKEVFVPGRAANLLTRPAMPD